MNKMNSPRCTVDKSPAMLDVGILTRFISLSHCKETSDNGAANSPNPVSCERFCHMAA
jgi:hypothetical protein